MVRAIAGIVLVAGLIAVVAGEATVAYAYVRPPTPALQLLTLSRCLWMVGSTGGVTLLVLGLVGAVIARITRSSLGVVVWGTPWYLRVLQVLPALALLDLILAGPPGVGLKAGAFVVGHGRSGPPTEIPLITATAYLWRDVRGYADLVVFVASLWVLACLALVVSAQRKRSGAVRP
jgi:hypothetical protein